MKKYLLVTASIFLGIIFIAFSALPGGCDETITIKEPPPAIQSVRLTGADLPGYSLTSSNSDTWASPNPKIPEVPCWRETLVNSNDKFTIEIIYAVAKTPELARKALEWRVNSMSQVGQPMNPPVGDESFSCPRGIVFQKGRVLVYYRISNRARDDRTGRWVSNPEGKYPSGKSIADKIISRIKAAGLDK